MDIQKLAAAMTEHLNGEDQLDRKVRIHEGLEVLYELNKSKGREAELMLNKYTMSGLIRLVTQRHAIDVPIDEYATDLHQFWADALGIQPDGSIPIRKGIPVAPRYQEADPESDAVAHLTDIFKEKY